jgi:PmbA protein
MKDIHEIIDKCLFQGVEDSEIIYVQIESIPIKFESNKLKYIRAKQTEGVGLRIIYQNKIGFASGTNLTKIDELIDHAISSALFGQEARFRFPDGRNVNNNIDIFDENAATLKEKDIVDMGYDIITRILDTEPKVKCNVEIGKSMSMIRIINSSGLDISYEKTYLNISVEVLLVQGQSLIWIFDGDVSCKYTPQAIVDISDRIVRKLKLSKREDIISTGNMPVIFTPCAVSMLVEPIEIGVNGKIVQKGVSPIGDKIGHQIVSNKLNIWDDATIAFAARSCPIDDEGITTSKISLIENGILKSHLFDLQTAGLMGVESTGSGYRDFDTLPTPNCSNLIIQPGDISLDKMIKEISTGLVAAQVMGSGQSNILAGEFSVNVDLGFKIEKGEITGRVKDVMIAGNVYNVLNRIVEIGSEVQYWDGIFAPSIWIDNISVVSGG